MGRGEKALNVVLLSVLIALLAFAARGRYKIAVQYDYSVDYVLGILDVADKEPRVGEYFGFYFLADERDDRYGERFVKLLGCEAGDLLETQSRDFYCNGKYIGTAKEYSLKGKPLPVFVYNGVIPEGCLFAVGESRDSYDSKIWGFVKKEWVIGTVHKIF